MQVTANSIIRKLRRNFGVHSTGLEAMNWLDTHGSDPSALKVLNEIERQSKDIEQIVGCTRWLQQHPAVLRSELVYGSNSHSHILFEQEKFEKETDAESGRGLRKLLHGAVNEQIVSIVHKWLSVFPSEKYSALLWAALLEVDASPETLELAEHWLSANKNDSAYDRVLAKLLLNNSSENALELAEELIERKQREGSIEAVTAVLSRPIESGLRCKAIEWCKTFLQGERSSYVASKLEELVYDPEVADLLLDWCTRNPEDKSVALRWARLLSKVPTEEVMRAAWEWLEPDGEQHDWDLAFQAFLDAAVQANLPLPAAALEEGWDIWERGDLSYCSHIGALMMLEPSQTVLDKMLLWIQANQNENETVSMILYRLIDLRPSDDVYAFATTWLRNQKVLDYRVTYVLCRMLQVAPNPVLIDLSHKLLPTCLDGIMEWLMLNEWICATNDEAAIQRAVELVNIEARLAFRQDLYLACGQLILTLAERKVEGIDYAKEQWLRWYSAKHPKFAKLFN